MTVDHVELSPYAPVARPTRRELFWWRVLGRWLGRPRPCLTVFVYVIAGVAYMNRAVYEPGPKTLIVKEYPPVNTVSWSSTVGEIHA